MRVGIVTVHNVANYGALLQTYATQRVFLEYFEDVRIIDYRLSDKRRFYELPELIKYESQRGLVYILNLPRKIYYNRDFLKSFKDIRAFWQRHLKLSSFVTKNNLINVNKEYDAVIVGSDQVWNPAIISGDSTYLLDFFEKKKYSYSSSFGVTSIDKNMSELYKLYLGKFRMLSTREKAGVGIIESGLDIGKASLILDPTFMLNGEEWRDFSKDYKGCLPKKPYILAYMVKTDKNVVEYAKKLQKRTGYEVVYVSTPGMLASVKELRGLGGRCDYTAEEWINLIDNAEYVVTNSFHGIAFTVNLGRKVLICNNEQGENAKDSRLNNIIDMLGLHNSVIGDIETMDIDSNMNYVDINSRLDMYRMETHNYIEKVVLDIKS